MVFLTRKLFLACQPNSGWERRANREWKRRVEIYCRYEKVITPLLPALVRQLCEKGLHDGVVKKAKFKDRDLRLVVDAANALGDFHGSTVQLTFHKIRRRVPISNLVGQWWLYHEAHLSSKARFSLHVLFDLSELEIEANDLTIDVLRQRGAPRRNARNTTTIEVNIENNLRLLKSLGISRKEFEEALPSALDK